MFNNELISLRLCLVFLMLGRCFKVKKTIVVLIILSVMCFGLMGCADNNGKDDTQVVNPITAYESLASLESAFGGDVAVFGDENTEGYSENAYALIEGEYPVAEVTYSNGTSEIVVRTAKTEGVDISGVTPVEGEYSEYESNGVSVKYALVSDDTYVAYWTAEGLSYSLYETEEMEETYFKVLIDYLTK